MGRKDKGKRAEGYRHPEASALLRPDVGTQAQFRKKKKRASWHDDASLSPALDWDGENPTREKAEAKVAALRECVELLGLDVFDPVAMDSDHWEGSDVPAWFLDADYNDLCFHVCQAFFPRTSAWEGLKRSLRTEFDDSVWAHLSGTVSAPYEAGEHVQIAVKVVDERGNELMVVKSLSDA